MVELRDYQKEAVVAALQHSGFMIACEQRTGKTLVATTIVRQRFPKTLLIVCPKVAIESVWRPAVADLNGIEVHIWNYEQVTINRRKWKRYAPEMIIADECHMIKDPNSARTRALKSLGRVAKWRLGLSGTPIEGGIENAWAQFDFIDPSIFGEWSEFKNQYLVMGGFRGKQIIGYKNREDFIEKFNSRVFRVLLEEVKPEPTKIRTVRVRFSLHESRKAYDQMHQDFVVDLNNQKQIVAPRVITQAMKLHQLTGGFILDEERGVHRIGNEKLQVLEGLLVRLGRPVVVFVKFLEDLDRISGMLADLKWTVTRISGRDPFTTFDTDAAVVQIRSGVCIDLARAPVAIFYSMDHSYITYDQAKFRIRSYHSNAVTYYYLLAENTVDEDIYKALTEKKSLSSVICDQYRIMCTEC